MTAQEIREEISRNRTAWHATDDKKKRQALHDATVELYGALDGLEGTTSTYDENTGVWTTTRPGAGDYTGKTLPAAVDRSAQITARQEGATESALAGLARAKNEQEAAIDARERAVAENYRAAREQAAARNEIARHNLAEEGAESGLNSGAAGQLALAQSVAGQSALGALDRQEAADRADLADLRQELETDYAYAVQEARAEGDRALADALTAEAARYEDAQLQRAVKQAGLDREVYDSARENREREEELTYRRERDAYQEAKDAYGREQDVLDRAERTAELEYKVRRDALDRAADAAKDSRAEAVKLAQDRAKNGDFRGYAQLGYSDQEIANMTRLWRYYQLLK